VQELDNEFVWYIPMIEGIAMTLVKHVVWGVRFRAYFCGFVSIADLASDTYAAFNMYSSGQTHLANALVAMVVANLFLQLIIVFAQHSKEKNCAAVILRETIFTLTFIKPGVEAHRVASGAKQKPGNLFGPLEEMLFCKNIELFTEAAPGFVLQSIAYLTSEEKPTALILSFVISAASAALTSTTTTYDMDTSPVKRKESPDMYGMIPETGRGLTFAVMFTLSFLQVLAKGFSVALLAVTNITWLLLYLVGDMGLYLLQKIIRQDFMYFLPLPRPVAFPVSVLVRIIVKVIADFTGGVSYCDPYELGGIYFSFNVVMNMVSVPIAVILYNEFFEEEGEEEQADEIDEGVDDESTKLDPARIRDFSIALVAIWTIVFVIFIKRIIVPKYRRKFYSTQTGWEHAMSFFRDNTEDERRILIFADSIALWYPIKEDVRKWTMERWEVWDATNPEWLSPVVIAGIPDEFIPPRFLAKMGGARERRGSAASVRRASAGMIAGAEENT
jgi:hypothetical protein